MTSAMEKTTCGLTLRSICMAIGYMHLVSSIVDIVCHVLTIAIATDGFQCDMNPEILRTITGTPWLEPFLLILNLGTHGFYPFPRFFRTQYNVYIEFMSTNPPTCYPGMLHVYLVDVLNFFINIIWLRIVMSYIGALHNKNPEPMRMFFSLSIVKLLMQIMYFGYQPHFFDTFTTETYWFLKVIDIIIAVYFLVIVKKYTNFLKNEILSQKVEKPPSYIECLMAGPGDTRVDVTGLYDKKDVPLPENDKKTEEKPANV